MNEDSFSSTLKEILSIEKSLEKVTFIDVEKRRLLNRIRQKLFAKRLVEIDMKLQKIDSEMDEKQSKLTKNLASILQYIDGTIIKMESVKVKIDQYDKYYSHYIIREFFIKKHIKNVISPKIWQKCRNRIDEYKKALMSYDSLNTEFDQILSYLPTIETKVGTVLEKK